MARRDGGRFSSHLPAGRRPATAGYGTYKEAIERYLLAFEAGTLPESQCGERVRSLGKRVAELRMRKEELLTAIQDSPAASARDVDLEALRVDIAELLDDGGDVATRKAALQVLVEEIRVDSRESITPYFRVPLHAPVRTLTRTELPAGLEPATPGFPQRAHLDHPEETGALPTELRPHRRTKFSIPGNAWADKGKRHRELLSDFLRYRTRDEVQLGAGWLPTHPGWWRSYADRLLRSCEGYIKEPVITVVLVECVRRVRQQRVDYVNVGPL